MLKYLGAAWAAAVALGPLALGSSPAPGWEDFQSIPGAFDLGQRADGPLVVAGSGGLYTLGPSGPPAPFPPGTGSGYLAVTPPLWTATNGCDNFGHDNVYLLRDHAPAGVTRVAATTNAASDFADLAIPAPTGIAFDLGGDFGHGLLVTGLVNGKTEFDMVDCTGAVYVMATGMPVGRGAIVVAPAYSGAISGELLLPDATTGTIWAIIPGRATAAVTGLPRGDISGVDSVAVVPSGFGADVYDSYAYFADRAGSRVLRVSGSTLVSAGVEANGLVAATADGGLFAISCEASCRATRVMAGDPTIHGDGHLVFSNAVRPRPTVTPMPRLPASDPVPPSRLANLVPFALLVGPFVLMALVAWALSRNSR